MSLGYSKERGHGNKLNLAKVIPKNDRGVTISTNGKGGHLKKKKLKKKSDYSSGRTYGGFFRR